MLHPLFSTIVHRPDLVAEHVWAYAELVQQEVSSVGSDLIQRGAAWAIAAITALLFLIFAGVALMLGVLMQFHWVLVAVPGAMLLLALLAYFRAKTPMPKERFRELKAQLASDSEALRTAA